MSQANPNILSYGQAAALLSQLQQQTDNNVIQDLQSVSTNLANVITEFEKGQNKPIFKFSKIEFGDPPLSSSINNIWNDVASDINLLSTQIDILRAAAIILYNTTTTELTQINNYNSEIANQIATIALFNNTIDSKTFIFGDQFGSGGNIDSNFAIGDNLAQIHNGYLTLAAVGQNKDLTTTAKISILPQSNGLPGDNQEVEDPTNPSTNIITTTPQYTFIASVNNPKDPSVILDSQSPNTFFEYEIYLVNQPDKTRANDYNFTYSITGNEIQQYPNAVNGQLDWSSGPSIGYLDLFLQIDLGSIKRVNTIVYKPYGLTNNGNYPILLQNIQLSSDGTTWQKVLQSPTWIGTIANQQTASVGANVSLGTTSWNVGNVNAEFIQFEIRQPNSIPCHIGHLYYTDPKTNQRVIGPIPDISNTSYYYTSGQTTFNSFTQNTEVFSGKRWAIGINDISVEQNQYESSSTMITKPINVNGIVDRVAINADIQIPSDFDSSGQWITFWISGDNGVNWYQISPIQNNLQGVNEVIAFNDPLPAAFRDPNVTYASTNQPVSSLRVKIGLSSPSSIVSETPIVKNYQLHVRLQ